MSLAVPESAVRRSVEENSDLAYKVNAVGARNLSVAAEACTRSWCEISTDDIFDGRASEPYNEFSTAQAGYGIWEIKAGRRGVCKTIAPKFLIIRSSWVYGDEGKFCDAAVAEAETESCIRVPGDQLGAPTRSADEVAKGDLPAAGKGCLWSVPCGLRRCVQPVYLPGASLRLQEKYGNPEGGQRRGKRVIRPMRCWII